jgi:hypothetical protein
MVMLLWSLIPLWEIQQLDDWRKQMKTNLRLEHYESQNLESFLLPVSHYSNLKTGDEIDFNGKRYDLMQVQKDGAYYHVVAFNDKKEKALLVQLGYNIQKSEGDVPLPPLAVSKVKWVYSHVEEVNSRLFFGGKQFPSATFLKVISQSTEIPTPPPEVFV